MAPEKQSLLADRAAVFKEFKMKMTIVTNQP